MPGYGSPPANEIMKIALAPRGKAPAIGDDECYFFATIGLSDEAMKSGPPTTGTLMETVGASKNYRINAYTAILFNLWHGHTTLRSSKLWPQEKLWGWLEWYIREQCGGSLTWGAGEGDAGVYAHTFLIPIRALRGLALSVGGHESLVSACDKWLLIFAVHNAAIFSAPWLGGLLPATEQNYAPVERPGIAWDCRLPPDAELTTAGVASCLVGPRTISDYNTGKIKAHLVGLRDSISDAIRETTGTPGAPVELTAALRRAGFDSSWPLSPEQITTIRAAHHRDPAAKAKAISWISTVRMDHETVVEECEGGLQAWLVRGPAGSTCPCDIHVCHAPVGGARWGRTVVATGNAGRHDAKGGADTIGPTRTEETATTLTTYRTDGFPGSQRVVVQKVSGRVRSRVSWGQFGHRVEIGGGAAVEDTTPPTTGGFTLRDLLTQTNKNMGVGDLYDWNNGAITGISAVYGKPDHYVIRKGAGRSPWATELIYVSRDNGNGYLLAETAYRQDGTVLNLRTFWRDINTPGVLWLTSSLANGTFWSTGYLVFNNISGTSEGLPHNQSPLPVVQHSVVKAESTLAIRGDLNIAGIRTGFTRSDKMNENTEVYMFGVDTDGLSPYIDWKSYRNGTLVAEAGGDKKQSLGEGMIGYGMFSDGTEGKFSAGEGMSVTFETKQSVRPVVPKKKESWWKGFD